MFFLIILINVVFNILRYIFIGYISRAIFKSNVYGLLSIVLYGLYTLVNELPFTIQTLLIFISLILSVIIYQIAFQGISMPRLHRKKRVTSLDIKTVSFHHQVMVLISILFIVFLWINQVFTSLITSSTPVIVTFLVVLYNGYVLYHDRNIQTYVIVRVGKSEFTYYQKELSSKVRKHRYSNFFNHPMFQLDYIAKVKYKGINQTRHDFVYSIKSDLNLTELGYEPFIAYDTSKLDDLKSYQLNTLYIKNNQVKIKRIT